MFDCTQFFEAVGRVAEVVRELQSLGELIDGAELQPDLMEWPCSILAAQLADRCNDLLAVFPDDPG